MTPEQQLEIVTRQLEEKQQTMISVEADYLRYQGYIKTEQQNILALNKEKTDLVVQLADLAQQEITLEKSIKEMRITLEDFTKKRNEMVEEISEINKRQEKKLSEVNEKTERLNKLASDYESRIEKLAKDEKEYAKNHAVLEAKVMKLKEIMNTLS